VNPEKTKYMLTARGQKAGQKNHIIKTANRSFEEVAEFKYLGTTLTHENCMHEELKSRLNSGNPCYHLAQSLSSLRLLFKDVKLVLSFLLIIHSELNI
jgi:hypothetical protein